MSRLVLRRGRLVDGSQGWDGPADIYLEDGRVRGVEPPGGVADGWPELDCAELWVLPGLVDPCVHGDPGGRAARGGYTTVVSATGRADALGVAEARSRGVLPLGAATEDGRPTDAVSLAAAGAVGLSDDPLPIADAGLARRVFLVAADAGLPVAAAPWDASLGGEGLLGDGPTATRLGLAGAPPSAEAVAVARDLILAEETGVRLHFSHLSTARALRLVLDSPATAAVTVHHLCLTAQAAVGYDTRARLRPPLREPSDREALVSAVAAGQVAVTSDDLAVSPEAKLVEYDRALPGAAAIEYCLPVCLQLLGPRAAVRALAELPARAFALDAGTLRRGAPADLVLFDPEPAWRVPDEAPTPLQGRPLAGRVVATYRSGKELYRWTSRSMSPAFAGETR